ncbi:hypothetical protein [Breoghania sp.]|uniref:cucumopine synthase-related protein n=1 Tax=Breoghania sp. TaxID=2065378 RepID=UPI0026123965|nr:hypothetical protein [Breoghania sp.]MDJ0933717.1 hypothetical protein [Breoghania sp.]
MTVDEAIKALEAKREKIWLESAGGSSPAQRRLCSAQHGLARTFADEFLWGIIRVLEDGTPDLKILQACITEVIGYKVSFFEFVGLPHACEMTRMYVDVARLQDQ